MTLKGIIKIILCRAGIILSHLRFALFGKKTDDIKMIPIIINNYNRLTYI